MALPVPTVEQLASFSGRPLVFFNPFAVQALIQATLYMSMVTELTDLPTDPMLSQVMTNGILDFALVTYLEQPYQSVKANPFQSQTIGGVSYSKPVVYMRGTAQANALKGEETGILWFDMAVGYLALRTKRGGVFGDALHVFDGCTPDNLYLRTLEDGTTQLLGPADLDQGDQIFFDWNFDGMGFNGNMETGV